MASTVHQIVASHAATHSSAVFVYDSTPSAPFGQDKDLPESPDAKLFRMETRQGAGAALVGFVERIAFSSEGVTPVAKSKPVSVLGSTASLLALVPSILALPEAKLRSPVAIHVSAQVSYLPPDSDDRAAATTSSEKEVRTSISTMQQVPDYASLFAATVALQSSFTGAIVLSETPEAAANASTGLALTLAGAGHDLISVFDGLTVGRSVGVVSAAEPKDSTGSLKEIVKSFTPYFTYAGSRNANKVIVLPAGAASAAAKAAIAAAKSTDIGVLAIHVLAPWSPEELFTVLPDDVKSLYVAKDLVDLVLEATLAFPSSLKVRTLPYTEEANENWSALFQSIAPGTAGKVEPLLPSAAKLAVFWGNDSTAPVVPDALVQAFSEPKTGVTPTLLTTYDNFVGTGLSQSLLLLSSSKIEHPITSIAKTSAPSVLFISTPNSVFKAYAPLETINSKTSVVLSTNWTAEDLATKLPSGAFETLKSHPLTYLVDIDAIAKETHVSSPAIAELVFWSLYLPKTLPSKEVQSLLSGSQTFATWSPAVLTRTFETVGKKLSPVKTPLEGTDEEVAAHDVDTAALSRHLQATAAGPNTYKPDSEAPTTSVWHSAAQRLIFPSAFNSSRALRPDLADQTYLVTCSENRRLTPTSYDRNVFHLEFDLAGTGLKYAVGEALGIHGWNDTKEVADFLAWYGVDADTVIEYPTSEGTLELRTAFQVVQQNLDVFGKPPKAFYSELAKFATKKEEERALRFIGAPEGAATFKKYCDVDFVTYADLLQRFPSARPALGDLVKLIEEIKPRHYSIASSQNFVGDSVHLLVVTVEWETEGNPRFGQCTRYLAGLKKGDQVTVSVKPSVMKLPTNEKGALIMAGLGTGAAPFRAFIQERAWMVAQGKEVGPALYYFGSRHRSKEYLYGEEIEAYVREGIVTHTGLAFSRDTDAKVYIQHKMNDDATLLASALEDGTFFLCGPTWPVPDVYEALIKALMGQGRTEAEAAARIEELKEEERYVLEVY